MGEGGTGARAEPGVSAGAHAHPATPMPLPAAGAPRCRCHWLPLPGGPHVQVLPAESGGSFTWGDQADRCLSRPLGMWGRTLGGNRQACLSSFRKREIVTLSEPCSVRTPTAAARADSMRKVPGGFVRSPLRRRFLWPWPSRLVRTCRGSAHSAQFSSCVPTAQGPGAPAPPRGPGRAGPAHSNGCCYDSYLLLTKLILFSKGLRWIPKILCIKD